MVKAVVGDEAHLKALEETLSSSSSPQSQVGLVVGKLSASSDRALVYALLPTPPTDADAPACSLRASPSSSSSGAKPKTSKGPSASTPSLEFDVDWIAEHARQVARMLLGGMSVIGVYIWASEASFKATSPAVLSQVSEDINISTEGPHRVDFLVPFENSIPAEECSLEGVAGLLRFVGSVSALAYLGPKESISEAISDLKEDIITSLRSRLDIILDEADDDSTTNDLEKSPSQKVTQIIFRQLREPYNFSFPRRVLIPWLGGTYVCDYLQRSETTEDATERCKEVISLETVAEGSLMLEPESAADSVTLQSFWDMVPGASSHERAGSSLDNSHPGQTDDSSRRQGGSFNILAALFALLVALVVGSVLSFSTSWNA